MFFNNWNALLQARTATTDFARNKHIAFFRGDVPVIPRSQSTSAFADLIETRSADWVCTIATTRTVTIKNADTLDSFDDLSDAPVLISESRFRGLDYDAMDTRVRTMLRLGRTIGAASEIDPEADYTPTWFVVTNSNSVAPFISANADHIDFIGEVAVAGSAHDGAVLLKKPLGAGLLPKAADFTMVSLPI